MGDNQQGVSGDSAVKGIAGFNLRDILEILALVRKLKVKELMNLPDVDNPVAVRAWLILVFDALAELTKYTSFTLDDDFVAQAAGLIKDDKAWESIYSLIIFVNDLIGGDDESIEKVMKRSDVQSAATAAGKRVGISPLLIIGIVQAAIALLRLLQQWRKNRNR